MGKSSINGPFSMAMLNNQMVDQKRLCHRYWCLIWISSILQFDGVLLDWRRRFWTMPELCSVWSCPATQIWSFIPGLIASEQLFPQKKLNGQPFKSFNGIYIYIINQSFWMITRCFISQSFKTPSKIINELGFYESHAEAQGRLWGWWTLSIAMTKKRFRLWQWSMLCGKKGWLQWDECGMIKGNDGILLIYCIHMEWRW